MHPLAIVLAKAILKEGKPKKPKIRIRKRKIKDDLGKDSINLLKLTDPNIPNTKT